MPRSTPPARPAASRRAGYLIAIIVNGTLLFLINASPGWQTVPFLTPSTTQVLGLVNLALAVSAAVNMIYLLHDTPRLRALGDLVTAAIGLTVAIRLWQVFPFAFHGSAAAWSVVVRVLLMIGIVGSCISVLYNLVTVGRRRATPQSR